MGGIFFGLMLWKMPFGIIMTGIGVIDYTNQLRRRCIPLKEAVVAAGATRLRPVFLTAITTILGLVPRIIGASYDFIKMSMS